MSESPRGKVPLVIPAPVASPPIMNRIGLIGDEMQNVDVGAAKRIVGNGSIVIEKVLLPAFWQIAGFARIV